MELVGTYNVVLVIVAILAAIGSTFVSFSVIPRIYDFKNGLVRVSWFLAFAVSFGGGAWTMHFIALLAYALPISVEFHLSLTAVSLVFPIALSMLSIALFRPGRTNPGIMLAALPMALGLIGMHYIGTAALAIDATVHYSQTYVFVAAVTAYAVSVYFLFISHKNYRSRIQRNVRTKAIGALLVGVMIAAVHFIEMKGTHLIGSNDIIGYAIIIQPVILLISIVIIAFLVQGGIFVTAIFDENVSRSKSTIQLIKRRSSTNKALADILAIGLSKKTLHQKMQTALEILTHFNWITHEQAGAIFMNMPNKQLLMVAQHNMPEEIQQQCKHINFGYCLCGTAAEIQEVIYKDCSSCKNEQAFNCMDNYAYYCLPIVHEREVLAVLVLQLEAGHKKRQDELTFLSTVADALATIITTHKVEDNATKIITAIEQAGEAVLIFDAKGMIEYINRAFTENTGFEPKDLVGKEISALQTTNHDDNFYNKLWATIITGEVWKEEIFQKRKDGSSYPCMLTVSPSHNSSGEITHYVTIHEDLTEKKMLEAQFRQAQKMEAVGTLVGGIAHDFNNMLAAITANLFLAKKNLDQPSTLLQKIDNVEQVSRRAAGMIKQLLTFARKDMVKMGEISLSDLMKESMSLLKGTLPENIQIVEEISDDNIQVIGDGSLLQQVVMNLVVNSRDAVEAVESPAISVSLKPCYCDEAWVERNPKFKVGNYAHICIHDNGSGIDKEDMSKVFEPFFTTKELGKGTGLGLSMVFGAVQSHSGVIEVESSEDEGTSILIYLPMVENYIEEMVSGDSMSLAEAKGETILLADDELYVREGTSEVLESIGYRVLQAEDGEQALEIFREHKDEIHLVLLDVVMPNLGGLETAQKIREINPNLPVILMTGYDRENVLRGKGTLENSKVLMKPVKYNVLSFTIRGMLS